MLRIIRLKWRQDMDEQKRTLGRSRVYTGSQDENSSGQIPTEGRRSRRAETIGSVPREHLSAERFSELSGRRRRDEETDAKMRMLWGILCILIAVLVLAIVYEVVLGNGTKETGSQRMNAGGQETAAGQNVAAETENGTEQESMTEAGAAAETEAGTESDTVTEAETEPYIVIEQDSETEQEAETGQDSETEQEIQIQQETTVEQGTDANGGTYPPDGVTLAGLGE
ncbi:MAG: hypothetical protein LUI07_03495 [Lachnospiraceae bacterium]|nr:hypothetical protein [Lachnospiraceae bacterium]